jgi:hypothetical protein
MMQAISVAAAALVWVSGTGDAQIRDCDLQSFIADQQARQDSIREEGHKLLAELKGVNKARLEIAEQRLKVLEMNPLKRGFKSTFDLNYDLDSLNTRTRDQALVDRQSIIAQKASLLKLEMQSLDLETSSFETRCGIQLNAPGR